MLDPHNKALSREYMFVTIGVFAVYSVLCFVAPEVLQTPAVAGHSGTAGVVLRLLIGVSPAIPLALWFAYLYAYYHRLDEVHRAVAERAAIITVGVTLTFSTGYGFIEINLNYPHFPLFFIYHVMFGVFCLTYFIVLRRMTS